MSQTLTAYEMVKGGHQTISELIDCVKNAALSRARISAQYADLAGEESTSYVDLMEDVRSSIGSLYSFLVEIEAERVHVHHWSEDLYCTICGMDGAA